MKILEATVIIASASPIMAIQKREGSQAKTEKWFEYPVRAQPHHTDYAGIVWHGTYLTWMEEARVECLRSLGIDFADLVNLGCNLPVVELSLRYHLPIRLGMEAVVKTRMTEMEGVRICWDYKIQSLDTQRSAGGGSGGCVEQAQLLHVTGQVSLVAIDREKGKIMRQIPPNVRDALAKLSQ